MSTTTRSTTETQYSGHRQRWLSGSLLLQYLIQCNKSTIETLYFLVVNIVTVNGYINIETKQRGMQDRMSEPSQIML
jgi:hypothetical protein